MSERYTDAVGRFYDAILSRSPSTHDRKLSIDTPLLPNALRADGSEWPARFAEYTGEVYSNAAIQGSLFRGLASLTRLTGNGRYQQAVDESLSFLLSRYQWPHTGLLPWGGHVAIDLTTGLPSNLDCPGMWAQHELKAHQPPFDMMWAVDGAGTKRFIEGFWREHVRDNGSYSFSRHGDMFGAMSGWFWEHLLRGYDGCQFMTSALDLATAAVLMWEKTGRRGWLDHARGMIKNFDDARNPDTGLAATSYTTGKRPPLLEGHCISRYAYCASIALRLGERVGAEGDLFTQTALRDLLAFGRYAYDEEAGGFFIRRWLPDGSRIDRLGRPALELSAYGPRGTNDVRNPALPAVLHSHAIAWRQTHQAELRPTIDRILKLLGAEDGFDFALQGGESAAYILQALIELWQADQDPRWRELAHVVADSALERFVDDRGYFHDWPDSDLCRLGQRLPLALLRLAAIEAGKEDAVDSDPGGGTYLDPNPKMRWRFDRHLYRLRTARIDCVVGDRYPHGGAADGEWDRAGVQSIGLADAAESLFEPGLGGLVFEPLASVHPNCNIAQLSPTAVLLENVVGLSCASGQEIPTLVEAVYSVTDDHALDLDVRLLPFLAEGDDEFILRCDSVFAAGATVEEAQGRLMVAAQRGTMSGVIMTHSRLDAKMIRTGRNRIGFEWHVPVATGVDQCLRMRVVVSRGSIDMDAEWRKFSAQQRPDIARLRRDAVATVQKVTMT